MPFCPKCGKEIDRLNYWQKKIEEAYFDGEGYDWWDSDVVIERGYECPECGELLFDNEEDAKKFLDDDVEAHVKAIGNLKEE